MKKSKSKTQSISCLLTLTLPVVIASALLASPSFAQTPRASGYWIGALSIDSDQMYVKLNLNAEKPNVHIPQAGISRQDLTSFSSNWDAVRFALSGPQGTVVSFDGKVKTDELEGAATLNGKTGTLRLYKYRPLTEAELTRYLGTYKTSDGRWIFVHRFSDGLELIDLGSGAIMDVWASANHPFEFIKVLPFNAGRPTMAPRSNAVTLEGESLLARWDNLKGSPVRITAARVSLFTEREVTLQNGEITIAGVLKTPKTSGPHPLVIIVPGSGINDHNSNDHVQTLFAVHGFAVFAYDKRGIGKSTGDYNSVDFKDLAGDVVKIVDELIKHPDIDRRNVILWGHSQGGWLAPLAVTMTANVSQLILVSGTTAPVGRQTTFWVEHYMRTTGFSESDIREAVSYMNLVTGVISQNGKGWELLEARLPEARTKRWWGNVKQVETKKDLAWSGFFYDPVPPLRSLRIPVLAIFGGKDILIPVTESAEEMSKIFRASHLTNAKVQQFAGADHNQTMAPTGNPDLDWPFYSSYAPGYFRLMLNWAESNLKGKN